MSILVIGAGSWGTAIALLLSKNSKKITIYSRNKDVISDINNNHYNTKYLNNIKLNPNIFAVDDLDVIKWDFELIFFALPSHAMTEIVEKIPDSCKDIPIIICSKGFDDKKSEFLHKILENEFNFTNYGILAGPNFAIEVVNDLFTCADLATKSMDVFEKVKTRIENENFKIKHSDCLIAVQISGIIKNIAAIACGIILGKNLGNNLRSIIIAKAFDEMKILCEKLGGNTDVLNSYSGLPDLVLTCTSNLSRNMKFGFEIGKNNKINKMECYPEGFLASKNLFKFCLKNKIKLPLCDKIYQILHENNIYDIKKYIIESL